MEISIGLDLSIDRSVLLFTLLVTVATTFLFGLAPALQATGSDVVSALKEVGIPGSYRRFSFRSILIASEIALSIVLLVPSGLFLRSLQNFKKFDI